MRLGQRVVFGDERRVERIGQVRRRWTVSRVKWCQRVERSFKWWYLQVAVDPLSGQWGVVMAFGLGIGGGGVVEVVCFGGLIGCVVCGRWA